MKLLSRCLRALLLAAFLLTGCGTQPDPQPESLKQTETNLETTGAVDLSTMKKYTLDNAARMKIGSEALAKTAAAYYQILESANFDYQSAWDTRRSELTNLVAAAKRRWVETSLYYELNEGIIAGVPSLSHFDVLIDAGPSGEEAPDEALDWTLDLPNGKKIEKPGNYFHSLLEPAIWGTSAVYTGLAVDLNNNGRIEMGEALPEANLLLGASRGLDSATQEMIKAVQDWRPTPEDAFTALVVMIPTMNEYFEQWKLSAYIAGENAEENAFIGASRLFDISGILKGLRVTYDNLAPQVDRADAELNQQIRSGFDRLQSYVDDLYQREQQGESFSAEQADLFGTEAQNRATALVAQVSQAAAILNIEVKD